MITRDEIRSIPVLYKQIQRDKEHLRYLQEKATSVPCATQITERVQESKSNRAGIYVDAAADLEKEIEAEETRLLELQGRAKQFIGTLSRETETEKLTVRILKLRYLKCYTWESIEELVGYVQRWPQQLEAEALKKL